MTAKRGRKPQGNEYVQIRISPEEKETLKTIGGSAAIRFFLQSIKENKMTFELYTPTMTEEQRNQFLAGWESAGGYTGDTESPAPWCTKETIKVAGTDATAWGEQYWKQVQPEVERLLAEEAEREEEDD